MELACFDNIDWVLLRKQKAAILLMLHNSPATDMLREHLEGMLALIDNIQDDAEKIVGPLVVFGRDYGE